MQGKGVNRKCEQEMPDTPIQKRSHHKKAWSPPSIIGAIICPRHEQMLWQAILSKS